MSTEKWNKIVAEYQDNRDSKEDIVQQTWKMLFSFAFHYARSEIDSQRPVKMGSTTKLADIVIKNSKGDLFVVELKRHALPKKHGQEQLFSYLNQLKVNLGILVCDKLHIYDYDYTAKDGDFSALEIPFEKDNPDGSRFVELFSKENFDDQKIKAFIAESNNRKNDEEKIRESITPNVVKDLLKKHLSEKYPAAAVDKILSEYSFSVVKKQPSGTQTNLQTDTSDGDNGKDNTQYTVNGELTGGKGPTVLAAVRSYVNDHPETTFPDLQKAFPDEAGKPGFGKVVRLRNQITQKDWDKPRFINRKEPIRLRDETDVFVSNQWRPKNMGNFIKNAKRLGIVIEPIPGTGKQS